jgi:hypothetical protein
MNLELIVTLMMISHKEEYLVYTTEDLLLRGIVKDKMGMDMEFMQKFSLLQFVSHVINAIFNKNNHFVFLALATYVKLSLPQ